MSQVNEAIQGLLDAESFGSVVTLVDGVAVGGKAVIDSTGSVVAGSLPEEIVADVVEDAMTLMDHEQHRALDYGDHSAFIETLAPPPTSSSSGRFTSVRPWHRSRRKWATG